MASGLQSSGPISMSDIMVEWIEQENADIHLTKYGDGESGLTPYPKNSGVQRKFSDYYGREYKVIREVNNYAVDVLRGADGSYYLDSLFQSYEKAARNRKRVVLNNPGTPIGIPSIPLQSTNGVIRWDLSDFNTQGEVEIRNYANIYAGGGSSSDKNGGNAIRFITPSTAYDVTINNYGAIYGGGGAGGKGGEGGEGQYNVGTTPTLSPRRSGGDYAIGQGYYPDGAPWYVGPQLTNFGQSALNNAGAGGDSGSGGTWGQPGTVGTGGEAGSIGGGATSLNGLTFTVNLGIGGMGMDGNNRVQAYPGLQSNVVFSNGFKILATGGAAGQYKGTSVIYNGNGGYTGSLPGEGIAGEHIVMSTTLAGGEGRPVGDGDVGGGNGGTILASLGFPEDLTDLYPNDSGGPANTFGNSYSLLGDSGSLKSAENVNQVLLEVKQLFDTSFNSAYRDAYGIAAQGAVNISDLNGGQAGGGGSTGYYGHRHGGNGKGIGQGGGGAGWYGGNGGDGIWGGGGGGAASDEMDSEEEKVALIPGDDSYIETATSHNLTNVDSLVYQVSRPQSWGGIVSDNPPDSSDEMVLQVSADNGSTWVTIDDTIGGSRIPTDRWAMRRITLPSTYRVASAKLRFLNTSSLAYEYYSIGPLFAVPAVSSDGSRVFAQESAKLIDFENESSYVKYEFNPSYPVVIVDDAQVYGANLRMKYWGGRGGDGWVGYVIYDENDQILGRTLYTMHKPDWPWDPNNPYSIGGATSTFSGSFTSDLIKKVRFYVAAGGGGGGGCGHDTNNEAGTGGGSGGFICYEMRVVATNVVGANTTPVAGYAEGTVNGPGAAGKAIKWTGSLPSSISFNNLESGTHFGTYDT